MSNYLTGGKLAYVRHPGQERKSWFSEFEFSGKFEGLLYHLDSPDAPNFDRKVAYILRPCPARWIRAEPRGTPRSRGPSGLGRKVKKSSGL